MRELAISIPNYNRIEKLKCLVWECIRQIRECDAQEKIEICISDDCSVENPSEWMREVINSNPDIRIVFFRFETNQGMDVNFLNSVKLADAKYCWIIGNDDLPEKNGLKNILNIIGNQKFDLLVTPFDMYDYSGDPRGTVNLFKNSEERRIYDVNFSMGKGRKLIGDVCHNCAFFTFLSNVVFIRERWISNIERFKDKMDTIFIQMYMDFQMLFEGAIYLYEPCHIIRNYLDDSTNSTIERKMRILCGLNDVADWFFKIPEIDMVKQLIVDPYLEGDMWTCSLNEEYRTKLQEIDSPKNRLYKSYFVSDVSYKDKINSGSVVIYGAGKKGKDAENLLKKNGYDDIIFATTEADGREDNVFNIDELIERDIDNKNTYIVANHRDLVSMVNHLLEKGISSVCLVN